MSDALTPSKFKLRQRVRKTSGDYHLDGVVVSIFTTLSGKRRYVVEHDPLAPGLLHIYSENNLEAICPPTANKTSSTGA